MACSGLGSPRSVYAGSHNHASMMMLGTVRDDLLSPLFGPPHESANYVGGIYSSFVAGSTASFRLANLCNTALQGIQA